MLEPESSCPDCGQPMQMLGRDVSEQLALTTGDGIRHANRSLRMVEVHRLPPALACRKPDGRYKTLTHTRLRHVVSLRTGPIRASASALT